MLINFKVPLMKEGIHRVFNNFGTEEDISKIKYCREDGKSGRKQ